MRTFVFLIGFVLLVGCKPTEHIDAHLKKMEDSTFVKVATEMLVLEGMHTQAFRKPNVPVEIYGAYKGIFERHNTSYEDWKSTMDYYLQNPDEMEVVYGKVVDYLPQLKQIMRDSNIVFNPKLPANGVREVEKAAGDKNLFKRSDK